MAGLVASVLLFVGIAPRACCVVGYAAWLSFRSIDGGPVCWFNYPYDDLRTEAVFLGIFVAPGRLWPWSLQPEMPRWVRLLLLWLLFRLMFGPGIPEGALPRALARPVRGRRLPAHDAASHRGSSLVPRPASQVAVLHDGTDPGWWNCCAYAANFHPHVHALVTDGLLAEGGRFFPLPDLDPKVLSEAFRRLVLDRLHEAGRLSDRFKESLLYWVHSGFWSMPAPPIPAADGLHLERMAR